MHTFLGPALADMLRADVKPALMAAVEEKFKDCPQHAPGSFTPARAWRGAAASPCVPHLETILPSNA